MLLYENVYSCCTKNYNCYPNGTQKDGYCVCEMLSQFVRLKKCSVVIVVGALAEAAGCKQSDKESAAKEKVKVEHCKKSPNGGQLDGEHVPV